MTILLLSLLVVFLVIGELCELLDRATHLTPRFHVASGFVAALLVVWIFAEFSAGEPVIPEPFYPSYWSGLKISVEKCTRPC